ncbi:MAG: hypothetical protein AAGF71_03625, partial [Pseudomonadota bacterium]
MPSGPLSVACLTMVRDDEVFLRHWLRHYGGLFGPRSLYVINHSDGEMVRDVANGANVIALPDGNLARFDAQRWRFLN